MIISILRCLAVSIALSEFTDWSFNEKFLFIILLELIAGVLLSKNEKPVAREEPEEITPENMVVTDVSEESACKYMDRDWPVWIEIDEDAHYIFDGQYYGPEQSDAFTLDDVTVVLPPGIRYKRLSEDNRAELADMMGVPVSELQLTTSP